jgi:hypothetical protein
MTMPAVLDQPQFDRDRLSKPDAPKPITPQIVPTGGGREQPLVWQSPDADRVRLIVVTHDSVYFSRGLSAEEMAPLGARLEAGERPTSVIPEFAVEVSFADVTAVELVEEEHVVLVHFGFEGMSHTLALPIARLDRLNLLFESLRRRIAPEARVQEHSAIWAAIKKPLGATGVLGLLAAICYWDALELEAGHEVSVSGRNGAIKAALRALAEQLGSKGAMALGCFALVAALVWVGMAVVSSPARKNFQVAR